MFSCTRAKTEGIVLLALLSLAALAPVSAVAGAISAGRNTECPMHRHVPASPSPAKHKCCQPNHDFVPLKEAASHPHGNIVTLLPDSEFEVTASGPARSSFKPASSPGASPQT